ncbi:uncharacterized protein BJ171DRAFT_438759 [Polychytrium aggregatum]|uniref:uncharacterized protein n=1 Tax=Polychytrium aggregatum TaxID=110093 RepID=UPI0022FE0910|nr:uncharacterized protein BJ171DRAFT_606837 [Polychytrium aggregatum]XP_052969837.1 uncharacterized protein BJ171DRAFT_438759 [Polychytrium aggregatum]KAI9190634.1 hypothetical protein BJ171DRAFT_606837 [Polychytrium aggregatum]KAI9207757.1 hypothetical protein BJ171DRAFT_438759 [Polychytrium aggregatum]
MAAAQQQQVPWANALQQAFRANFPNAAQSGLSTVNPFSSSSQTPPDPVVVQLASVKSNGTPKIQPLVFQDFLAADPRILVFSAATSNPELMSVVKSGQSHEIYWSMPKTKETFVLSSSSRLYIVCASTLSGRFGSAPRKVIVGDEGSQAALNPEEFWETERIRLWHKISPFYRASFTWPSSGEVRTPNPNESWSVYRDQNQIKVSSPVSLGTGFRYTRLDVVGSEFNGQTPPLSPSLLAKFQNATINNHSTLERRAKMTKEEEDQCVHNAAFDNFCLIIFKVTRVDHTACASNNSGPPTRTVYTCTKEGSWVIDDVNP